MIVGLRGGYNLNFSKSDVFSALDTAVGSAGKYNGIFGGLEFWYAPGSLKLGAMPLHVGFTGDYSSIYSNSVTTSSGSYLSGTQTSINFQYATGVALAKLFVFDGVYVALGGGAGYSLSKMALNSAAEIKASGFVGIIRAGLGYEYAVSDSIVVGVFVYGTYTIDAGIDSTAATALKISGAQKANSITVTPGLSFGFRF